jgi:hypothetical protein
VAVGVVGEMVRSKKKLLPDSQVAVCSASNPSIVNFIGVPSS